MSAARWEPDPQLRYLVAACNGSGKSTLLAWLARAFLAAPWMGCVIIDPKADRQMHALAPMASPWQTAQPRPGRIVRIVPPADPASPLAPCAAGCEPVLSRVYQAGNCLLVIDETQMVAGQYVFPPSLLRIYQQGRARQIPVLAATTEPVRIPTWIRSQSRGFFCGAIGEGPQLSNMAALMRQDARAFSASMRGLPPYHFLYWQDSWAAAHRPPEEVHVGRTRIPRKKQEA